MPLAEQEQEASALERYEDMFRAHYGRVVRWLTVLGVCRADVDDVAQEVFIIAHRKLDQLRADASVTGWLLGITRHVSATARRTRKRAEVRETQAEPPQQAPNPEAIAMRNEAAQRLHEFLVSLPEQQRLVFVLYEMDGATANEVAEAMGISRNTVHSRVRLIREKLARAVARHRAKGRRENV
ncbi:MAG: sigma-70 family RNA polymerase sigma factor [Nannocystaceae bacterium]|nr:sigma-70 family RNA polymerase sigma factor [Nannocystaceae bacterium]